MLKEVSIADAYAAGFEFSSYDKIKKFNVWNEKFADKPLRSDIYRWGNDAAE